MNILKSNEAYDVVVIGAGLAGIKAAVTAAQKGCRVLLCSKSILCAGSSFYTLMDTLHCQAVIDEADKEVFLRDIADCSYGMNDPVMNRYYADHIRERITELPAMGIPYEKLPEPKLACFAGHPHDLYYWSDWNAIRVRLTDILEQNPSITFREKTEAAAIAVGGDKAVSGVILYDKRRGVFEYVPCASLILATGGFGALYKHNLNSPDVAGDGHALALAAGASLINLEFNQFIPGLLKPVYKVVFREGTLDYCDALLDRQGHDILREALPDTAEYAECLRIRASHGPFTSAGPSMHFDLAMMKACEDDPDSEGAVIQYSPKMERDTRSYVAGYLQWLKETYRVNLCTEKVTIAPFFHAANGGILVDHRCETEVRGLFACGEAAGGIHGADRLGGNASGSCLVFGYLAAESAAAHAKQVSGKGCDIPANELSRLLEDVYGTAETSAATPQEVIAQIREEMWLRANVLRSEESLLTALASVQKLRAAYHASAFFGKAEQIPAAMQAQRFLTLSQAILTAMRNRTESRGAHYREDYPRLDSRFDRRWKIHLRRGEVLCVPE